MKAVIYESFGGARDVLSVTEMQTPELLAGDVSVRMAFSGVNPSDVKARSGARPGVSKPAFAQIIPHSDGSGIVEAVGAGVDSARIGERVWIWNAQWQRANGTCAEICVLPSEQAVRLPDSVDLQVGAVLGIPGLTACHCVFGGGDVTGKTLLISGAAGTVGYLATQLAKWGGARVLATGSVRDHDRILAAGADAVFDYNSPTLAADILAANDGALIDLAVEVEFGDNSALLAQVMAENSRVAIYGSGKNMTPTIAFGPLLYKALTLDIALIYILEPVARAHAIALLTQSLKEGVLVCPIQEIVPLNEAALAHEMVESGGRSGAVLVKCDR